MHGGAQLQFATIPMNILGDATVANYAVTGIWSKLAVTQAQSYAKVVEACDTECLNFTTIPTQSEWQIDNDAGYFYYCDNETVQGVEFHNVPDVVVPLVCDMSSNLLTRSIDVSKFGIIMACAQKNLGPAGVTVVIIRDDLLACEPRPYLPSILNYRLQARSNSMKNTPATFSWYMLELVLAWVKEQGGVDVMHQRAQQRSKMVYDFIDASDLYVAPVNPACRSRMNIVFDLIDENLNEKFLTEAESCGLAYLKGHKTRGGMRASMYNAMPVEGAERLVAFMREFESQR